MRKYCLDTNIFIEPWNKYYSKEITKGYWEILEQLARDGLIFSPSEVEKEIEKIDDDLLEWIKGKNFFEEPDTKVQECLKKIMKRYPRLVDASRGRSMADPWVIAHAQAKSAVVVTLEQRSENPEKKIKIPDVCQRENITFIDIYDLIKELNIKFIAEKEVNQK